MPLTLLSPTALNPEGCWVRSTYLVVADPQGEAMGGLGPQRLPVAEGREGRAGERNGVDAPHSFTDSCGWY